MSGLSHAQLTLSVILVSCFKTAASRKGESPSSQTEPSAATHRLAENSMEMEEVQGTARLTKQRNTA